MPVICYLSKGCLLMRTCEELSKILIYYTWFNPQIFPHVLLAENKTIWDLIVKYFTLHWTMPLYLVRHCQVAARAFSQPFQLQASSKAESLQAHFLLILHLSCLLLDSSNDSCLPITKLASQAKWVFPSIS